MATTLKPPPGVDGRTQDCFGHRWREREQAALLAIETAQKLLGCPPCERLEAGLVFDDGSGPLEHSQADWRDVATICGLLDYISVSDMGIMTRFADPPARTEWNAGRTQGQRIDSGAPLPSGANRHNGKWNFHFFDSPADVVVAQFASELRRILPPTCLEQSK